MTLPLSKRHQARNERYLHDLIKAVPGNDRCADCGARNPGWASWSLGIFLCMRCAALHRRLGTHISKVKSLSMDSWSNEQVDSMKSRGNTTSNHIYNPKNTPPPIPLDVDEVDAAMEKFIRQKYDQQVFSGRKRSRAPAAYEPGQHDTGSSDEQPPPPPPKFGRRFGFGLRSASSALTLSRSSQDFLSLNSSISRKQSRAPSPIHINNQSRVFGPSVGLTEEGMDWKLVTLKEMGFPDDKRNSNVLKGLGGDLERAIESLVRLGEGTTSGSRNRTPTSAKFPDVVNRVVSKSTVGLTQPSSLGIKSTTALQRPVPSQTPTQYQTAGEVTSSTPSVQSYNPFENIAPPPMSAPFQQQQYHQQSLENVFQTMHVSQPLFPNNTGGHLNEQARMQQSVTPPVPQMPNQFMQNNSFAPQPTQPYNPFLASPQQKQPRSASTNPYWTPQQPPESRDIYQSQTSLNCALSQSVQSPYQLSQQQWAQIAQQSYQGSPQQTFSPQSFGPPLQPPLYMQQQNYQGQFQSMPQPLLPQQAERYDKSSIMALYDYPQLAPPPLIQDLSGSNVTSSSSSPQAQAAKLPPGISGLGQRSATMPAMLSLSSKNPFVKTGAAVSPTGTSQMDGGSRQSSIDNGHSSSGRHSPDAFASLSARFVR